MCFLNLVSQTDFQIQDLWFWSKGRYISHSHSIVDKPNIHPLWNKSSTPKFPGTWQSGFSCHAWDVYKVSVDEISTFDLSWTIISPLEEGVPEIVLWILDGQWKLFNNKHPRHICCISPSNLRWVFGRFMGTRKWCGLVLLFLGAVAAGWPSDPTLGKRCAAGFGILDGFVWRGASYVWLEVKPKTSFTKWKMHWSPTCN